MRVEAPGGEGMVPFCFPMAGDIGTSWWVSTAATPTRELRCMAGPGHLPKDIKKGISVATVCPLVAVYCQVSVGMP